MNLEGQSCHPPEGLHDCRAHGEIRHEVSVHHVDVDPIRPGPLRLDHLVTEARKIGVENRRRQLHGAHVLEASKMLWMEASSSALYSASDCCAESPSTSAREKLATTPWFLRKRRLPSSRE